MFLFPVRTPSCKEGKQGWEASVLPWTATGHDPTTRTGSFDDGVDDPTPSGHVHRGTTPV